MWKDVEVDSYIRDGQGTTWRICAIDMADVPPGYSGHLRCKNRQGEWLTIAPKPGGNPVTLMVPEDDAEPHIALLRDQLGATVLAQREHGSEKWTCSPWPAEHKGAANDFRLHLESVHGMHVGDVKGFAKLREVHEHAHSEPWTPRAVPHTH